MTENCGGSEYRVGMKSLYDLYPAKVKDRILAEDKRKNWDVPNKEAITKISREIEILSSVSPASGTLEDKIKKENLDCCLEFLNSAEKKYSELNTVYDCILYSTKDGWVAVIDTTESGNLEDAIVLAEYSVSHDLKSINEYLSVSINVHDDGDVLEIVGLCCMSLITRLNAIAKVNSEFQQAMGHT